MTKETAKTLALAALVGLTTLVVGSLVCVWVSDADNCEQMICELLVMRRPLSDVSYCEAWFDLFR
jgi:hypothetical protein